MKLSGEQIKEIQEKMVNAKSPEELVEIIKEFDEDITVDDITNFREKYPDKIEPLGLEDLEQINGGEELDIPQFKTIRDYYLEKGPNSAFILCIYFIPSPICYEIIQVIEKENR